MTRLIYAMMAAAGLAACEGVGGDDGGSTPAPEPDVDIATEIANNLDAATFASGPESLTVSITLDAGRVDAVYDRNPDYDLPGYLAFTTQNNPLNRYFTGFANESTDGSVQAVVVADGGQFTKFFGGATYRQTGAYSAPTEGIVSYAGKYAGLINLSTPVLPLPDTNDDLLPLRAGRVSGDVFLNASFATNRVNGAIYNRVYEDGTGVVLDTVFLVPTEILTNGSFAGVAENRDESGIGSYAGTFGGTNASSVAGAIRLTGDFVSGVDNEDETGIFVLGRCGATGGPAVCDIVNDQ